MAIRAEEMSARRLCGHLGLWLKIDFNTLFIFVDQPTGMNLLEVIASVLGR